MTDPFRTVALRARVMKAGALIILTGLMVVIGYLQFGTVITDGREVKAEVLRLGAQPTGGVAGANLPILTVRTPDGSVRQVMATWADVNDCKPGRSISIVEKGPAVRVGRPGCTKRAEPTSGFHPKQTLVVYVMSLSRGPVRFTVTPFSS